jgi:hypothetical protein
MNQHRKRLLTAMAFLAAAATAEPRALADDAEQPEAAQHFQRGLKLFDDGDFKLALVEFERSYELVPNFRVLYNVGEVEFQLNSYARAMKTLTRYLEEGGEKIPPTRRAEVEKDLENLKIRIGYLRVNVDIDGAEILVDGERIGRSPMMSRELVDAGAHRITVQKSGFTTASDAVTLVGGDDKNVSVHLAPIPQIEAQPRIIEVHEPSGLGPVWVGWGLTVALGIGTVGTAVAWQSADSKLTDLKASPSSANQREDQAHTVDTLRTLTFVLGGATLAAAGVSLFFTVRRGSTNIGLGTVSGRF